MLLAFDLETTGLNPLWDNILEVGWCVIDAQFDNPLTLVREELVTTTPADLSKMNEVVCAMHEKSGLTNALVTKHTKVIEDIEDEILSDIEHNVADDEEVYLFGASPQFDHQFVEVWMPRLHKRLHYRHYDVSTLKAFFASIGTEIEGQNDAPEHRAGADVMRELELADSFRQLAHAAMEELIKSDSDKIVSHTVVSDAPAD